MNGSDMPGPDVSKMGYNPANFAYWIGEEPWVPGYFVTMRSASMMRERRSNRSDQLVGSKDRCQEALWRVWPIRFQRIRPGGQRGAAYGASSRGNPKKMIHEIPDNVTTKYPDDVR